MNIIFDAHCDTIGKVYHHNSSLVKNEFHVDLNRMNEFDGFVQIFAAFTDTEKPAPNPLTYSLELIDRYYYEISLNPEKIVHCENFSQIENALAQKKIAAMLAIEGGEALCGSIGTLNMLYKLGVRLITLTWNNKNEIADGIREPRDAGLTGFGRDVVRRMNELGMLIDVSHISEKGFWDVLEITEKPITASHSNSKEICSFFRNLNDEQIKAIIKNGGVIGINFCPDFLRNGGEAGITDIMKHIEKILSLGGENNLGFGCDFDGIDALPAGISGVSAMKNVIDEMIKLNYTEEIIQKITHKNFMSLIKKVM